MKKIFALLSVLSVAAFANWSGTTSTPASITVGSDAFYEVSSPEELAWFAAQVNSGHPAINAILKNDIVFFEDSLTEMNKGSAHAWTPISYSPENAFSGVFEGNGHKIKGLYLQDHDYSYVNGNRLGFFGHIAPQGVVRNVGFEKNYMDVVYQDGTSAFGSETVSFGPLAGKNEGTIENVTVGGSVKLDIADVDQDPQISYGSGVVGQNYGTLANATFSGTIISKTSSTNIGGIVGINAGQIDFAINRGSFVLDNSYVHYVGGIAYGNTANITHSDNYADIIAQNLYMVGGIASRSDDSVSVVSYCRNYGKIESGAYADSYYGGIAAYSRGIVSYSENRGNIRAYLSSPTGNCVMGCEGYGGKVGGIVGYAQTKRYGTSSPAKNHGLVDRNTNYGNITVSTNSSTWSIPPKLGGVVGHSRTNYVTNNRNFGDLSISGTIGYLGTIIAQADSAGSAYSIIAGNYSVCDTVSTVTGAYDNTGIIAYVKGSQKQYRNFGFRKTGDEEKLASDSLAYMLNKWTDSYGNTKAWSRGISYPVLADETKQPSFQLGFFANQSKRLKNCYTDSTGIVKDAPEAPVKEDSVFLGWRYSEKTTQNDLRLVNLEKVIDRDYKYLYPFYGDKSIERHMYTFYNDDGSIMWSNVTRDDGSIPYPTNVTKATTAQYTYSFDGWMQLSEYEYQATFEVHIRSYEIKFYQGRKRLHSSDSLIYTVTVEYGQIPEYQGDEPAYDSLTSQGKLSNYVYSFSGQWKPALAPVTGAQSYRAIIDSTYRKYEITFFNYDSIAVLQQSKWEYNSIPQYDGEVPTKAPVGNKIYIFSGWDPEPKKVTEATAYYAKFDSVKVKPGSSSSTASSSSATISSSSVIASSSSASVPGSSETVSSSSETQTSSSSVKPGSSTTVSSSSVTASSSSVIVSSSSETQATSSSSEPGSSTTISSSSVVILDSSASVPSSSETASSSSTTRPASSSVEPGSSDGTTEIKTWQRPQFSVQTRGRTLQISGAHPGRPFAVMDMQGKVITHGVSAENYTFTLPHSGAYLVRVGNAIVRVDAR